MAGKPVSLEVARSHAARCLRGQLGDKSRSNYRPTQRRFLNYMLATHETLCSNALKEFLVPPLPTEKQLDAILDACLDASKAQMPNISPIKWTDFENHPTNGCVREDVRCGRGGDRSYAVIVMMRQSWWCNGDAGCGSRGGDGDDIVVVVMEMMMSRW